MRVLLGAGVPESSGGGIATYARRVAEGIEKLGAHVDVSWVDGSPSRLPGPVASLQFSRALARAALRGKYDIVAAQGIEGAVLRAGPGRVVTSHGDQREGWKILLSHVPVPARERFVTPYLGFPLWTRAIRHADVVIALNPGEVARFRAERRRDPSSVHLVPNGCGPVHLEAEAVPGQIVFLGNWLPRKGSLLIPEIFRQVRLLHPAASLTLVGPDPSVEAQFDTDDRAHVRTLGFVDPSEAERVLASSDVLLLPSFIEGMPLAVLEALAFGVPTVGFDIPGTEEAAGSAGVLVQAGDVTGCVEALVRVMADRGLRESLSRQAFARAEQLTWAATARATLAAYEHAARIAQSR